MRKITLMIALFISLYSYSQQSFSSNFINDVKKYKVDSLGYFETTARWFKIYGGDARKDSIKMIRQEKRRYQRYYRINGLKMDLPVFGISGIGNLNQESLSSLNASGKIALYARPVQFRNNAITIYASYNKSASNNDSVLYEKLIFPEIGNSSFSGTLQFDKIWRHDTVSGHALSPFFEFSMKKIISDSTADNQNLYFRALSYTIGVKYTFGYTKKSFNDSTKSTNLSFFAIPYLSFLNIPNEDVSDYRALVSRNVKLISSDPLTDNISTWGIKIGFQINNLQVFSDFRSVLNNNKKVPVRALQGFHSNIGIIFNADVLEFRK